MSAGPTRQPAGRLALLVTSPRVAPGLMSRDAWHAVDAATAVWAATADEPLAEALAENGIPVEVVGPSPDPASVARLLVSATGDGDVVWLGSADGDPGLSDAVASEVTRLESPPEVEVLIASWDVPGARLLDVVAVMDRLRSPGGCPWDAQQTHTTLVPYLREETEELVEAIESGDRPHVAEELGDVLFQVAFHARVAEEDADQPFDIDDVAAGLVDKLVRRHPHVFADGDASTPEEVEAAWARIKAEERATEAASLPSEGELGRRIPGGSVTEALRSEDTP